MRHEQNPEPGLRKLAHRLAKLSCAPISSALLARQKAAFADYAPAPAISVRLASPEDMCATAVTQVRDAEPLESGFR